MRRMNNRGKRRAGVAAAVACACAAAMFAAGCGGSSAPQRSHEDVQILHGTTPQDSTAGTVGDYKPTGKLIADTGFRPPADGFGFENYGVTDEVANLTPAAVEEVFGHEVCANGSGATCKLIPSARAWMEEENDAMNAGHCFGMAVAVARFYGRQLYPDGFGAPSPAQLALLGNAPLQRTIAESNAIQEIPTIRKKAFAGTPNQILDHLIAGIKAKKPLYVLGLFRTDGGGGHAVTPYAVEDRGDGRYAILVYDNNFPGITRAVSFDRHADAWKFVAQSNPEDPNQLYGGSGVESNLALYPGIPPKGVLPCPFCNGKNQGKKAGGDTQQFNEIALEGDATNHAHVVITDAKGRRTGYVNGKVVNEIPGAEVMRRLNNKTWAEDAEPVYLVPAGRPVSVLVDGRNLKKPVVEKLEFIGPGDRVEVEGIALRRGEHIRANFAGDGSSVSLRTDPHHDESPVLRVGIEDAPDSYDFALKARRLTGGSKLNVRLDQPHYQFDIDTRGVRKAAATSYDVRFGRYDLSFERMTPTGTMTFRHPNLLLPPGTIARLDYKGFNPHHRTLDLELLRNGHTKIEKLRG